jgi:hypothetical protein
MAALRQRVLENPALLQPTIQHLVENNPQLATLLTQNPELLLQLLGGAGAQAIWNSRMKTRLHLQGVVCRPFRLLRRSIRLLNG